MSSTKSPGNDFAIHPDTPEMRLPHLKFVWRLECEIAKEEIEVGAAHGTGVHRSIANIVSGEVQGPGIKGTILPLGGADWATVVEGTHVRNSCFPRSCLSTPARTAKFHFCLFSFYHTSSSFHG